MDNQVIIEIVRRWLEEFVIEFNICPFAARELRQAKVRFKVSEAKTDAMLLLSLEQELAYLQANPETETTLLIHPYVCQEFLHYNEFLSVAELFLQQMKLVGEIQIASFHPDYQFAGTDIDDAENFTNRAPFPLLHLLRESSVSRAVDYHPNVDEIPSNNIRLMNDLGNTELKKILAKIVAA